MAVGTLRLVTGRVKLENGRDAQGKMTYVNQSLGNLKEAAFTGNAKAASLDSVIAIVGALEPCIKLDVGSIELVSTEQVTSD